MAAQQMALDRSICSSSSSDEQSTCDSWKPTQPYNTSSVKTFAPLLSASSKTTSAAETQASEAKASQFDLSLHTVCSTIVPLAESGCFEFKEF